MYCEQHRHKVCEHQISNLQKDFIDTYRSTIQLIMKYTSILLNTLELEDMLDIL